MREAREEKPNLLLVGVAHHGLVENGFLAELGIVDLDGTALIRIKADEIRVPGDRIPICSIAILLGGSFVRWGFTASTERRDVGGCG